MKVYATAHLHTAEDTEVSMIHVESTGAIGFRIGNVTVFTHPSTFPAFESSMRNALSEAAVTLAAAKDGTE